MNYGQDPNTPLSIEMGTAVPAAKDFVDNMYNSLKAAKEALIMAQNRQKLAYDAGRRPQDFAVDQLVLLNSKHIKFKGSSCKKLMPKWIGPYKVVRRAGEQAYELQLPPALKALHNVFHTEKLQLWKTDGRYQPPPPAVTVDGELEWEVEQILMHRHTKWGKKDTARGRTPKLEYLVKWTGYGAEQNSWEPVTGLTNCKEVLADYWVKTDAAPPIQKSKKQKIG